jgi:hypothetical protein
MARSAATITRVSVIGSAVYSHLDDGKYCQHGICASLTSRVKGFVVIGARRAKIVS